MYQFSELFLYKFVFIAELLIAMHLISFNRKRRSKYPLRVVLGAVVCLAVAAAYPIASYSAWYSSLMFVALFLVCMASLYLTYEISFKWLFFLSVSAYTMQHFAHELFSLIANAANLVHSSTLGMYGDAPLDLATATASFWLSALVYVMVYFLSYLGLYKLAGKRINREDVSISNFSIVIIAALILAVDIVLNAVSIYIKTGYNQTYTFLTCIYNLICCVLILSMQVGMCIRKTLERELEKVSLLLHKGEEQFHESKEHIGLMDNKCDELKEAVREYANSRNIDAESVNGILELINIYDCPIKTGLDALDLILTEKHLLCRKRGINLTCHADCSQLGFLGDTDVYGLFGHIIDNAIEAVSKLPEEEKRNINVIIKNVNSFVSIEVQNYYTGEFITDENGIPVTTKDNKDYHGYGFKAVGVILEKYNGDIRVSADNGIFTATVLFPVAVKEDAA